MSLLGMGVSERVEAVNCLGVLRANLRRREIEEKSGS